MQNLPVVIDFENQHVFWHTVSKANLDNEKGAGKNRPKFMIKILSKLSK